MTVPVPQSLCGFILGFARDPRWTYAAGVYIIGYYWALIAQWLLRSFAAACLRGWK